MFMFWQADRQLVTLSHSLSAFWHKYLASFGAGCRVRVHFSRLGDIVSQTNLGQLCLTNKIMPSKDNLTYRSTMSENEERSSNERAAASNRAIEDGMKLLNMLDPAYAGSQRTTSGKLLFEYTSICR